MFKRLLSRGQPGRCCIFEKALMKKSEEDFYREKNQQFWKGLTLCTNYDSVFTLHLCLHLNYLILCIYNTIHYSIWSRKLDPLRWFLFHFVSLHHGILENSSSAHSRLRALGFRTQNQTLGPIMCMWSLNPLFVAMDPVSLIASYFPYNFLFCSPGKKEEASQDIPWCPVCSLDT